MRYIRNVGAANAILYALAQLDKPFYTELCHASELKSGTFATRMADLLDMEIIGRIQGGRPWSIALRRLPFCEHYVPILVPVRISKP